MYLQLVVAVGRPSTAVQSTPRRVLKTADVEICRTCGYRWVSSFLPLCTLNPRCCRIIGPCLSVARLHGDLYHVHQKVDALSSATNDNFDLHF